MGEADFLKGLTLPGLRDELEQSKRDLHRMEVDHNIAVFQNVAAQDDYESGQRMQENAIQSQQTQTMMLAETLAQTVEDDAIQNQFRANIFDQTERMKVGTPYPEGVPRSVRAAANHYIDAMHYMRVADKYRDSINPDGLKLLQMRYKKAQKELFDSYRKNFNLRDDEVNEIMTKRFPFIAPTFGKKEDEDGKVVPSFGPPTAQDFDTDLSVNAFMAEYSGLKQKEAQAEEKGFWEKRLDNATAIPKMVAGHFVDTALKTLSFFEILDAPLLEAGMEIANVYALSDAQFLERYPDSSVKISELNRLGRISDRTPEEEKRFQDLKKDLSEVNWLERFGMATMQGIKEAGKEVKRIVTGGEYDPSTLNEFATTVTDDPRMQEIVKQWVPLAFSAGFGLALEVKAAKMVSKLPPNVLHHTPLGRVLDVLVAGRATSWLPASHFGKIATAAAIERQARINAGIAHEKAMGAAKYGPVEASARDLTEALLNGQWEREDVREVARDVIVRLNNRIDDLSPEDKDALNALESRLKESEAMIESGRMVSLQTATLPKVEDATIRQIFDDRVASLDAVPKSGVPGMTTREGVVLYDPEMTRKTLLDGLFDGDAVATKIMNELGVSKSLMSKLIATDEEARLFALLHEEGHVKMQDYVTATMKGEGNEIRRDSETMAHMFAFDEFTRLTGKPFFQFDSGELYGPGKVVINHPKKGFIEIRAMSLPRIEPGDFITFENGRFRYNPTPDNSKFQEVLPGVVKRAKLKDAPEDVQYVFERLGGAERDFLEIENTLAQYGRSLHPKEDLFVYDFAKYDPETGKWDSPDDFNAARFGKLGGLFELAPREGESAVDYGHRVIRSFEWRFGDMEHSRLPQFPDAQPEYAKTLSPEQLLKAESLYNTWAAILHMAEQAKGTNLESRVNNFASWFKSHVNNGGASYRAVKARTESFNRQVRAQKTGLEWEQSKPGGKRNFGGNSLTDFEASSGGQVFGPGGPTGAGGAAKIPDAPGKDPGLWSGSAKGPRLDKDFMEGKSFGPDDPESVAVRSDDALANAASIEDLMRKNELGETTGELDYDKIAQMRKQEFDAQRPVIQGPVDLADRALVGTADQVRLMELEQFADSSTVSNVMSGGRINVFQISSDQLESITQRVLKGPLGPEQFNTFYRRLANNQLKGMAARLTQAGGTDQELMVFNRTMAIAKGMQEVLKDGKVSARTRAWLDELSFDPPTAPVAEGMTLDQRILSGIDAAAERHRPFLSVTEEAKKPYILDAAEKYHLLGDSTSEQTGFINAYTDFMTGNEAARLRKALQDGRKKLVNIIGGPCLG